MLRLFIHSPKVVHSILFPVKEKKKTLKKYSPTLTELNKNTNQEL